MKHYTSVVCDVHKNYADQCDCCVLTDRQAINRDPHQKYLPVSEDFAMEMLEVLPPIKWRKTNYYETFLVGEAMKSTSDGRLLYETFTIMYPNATIKDPHMIPGQWYYMGLNTA